MVAAIELHALEKSFAGKPVLRGVTLSVEPGEIFGYVGANGAGKTTTLRILAGLSRPTQGLARVAGHDMSRDRLAGKARLGYVPESGAIFEKLTPREMLTAMGRLQEVPEETLSARVPALLERFGLLDRADERMDVFNKGSKQKVAIISALLHDPDVLLLDEPLNGLDVETISCVKELLRELSARGKTVFYTSHLADVLERICTRIGVLDQGRLIVAGSVSEILGHAGAKDLETALMDLRGRGTIPPPPPSP